MSESTPPPDSTRTLFELQRLSAEVEELNILLEDSDTIIRSLFQLLRDHNVPVGSTELIKAREKVEAEIQTLRTANAGLVERVKRLERELAEAKRDAARYEVVRKMNAADFSKLFQRCITEDLRFDDEVDKIGGLQ